MCTLPHELFTSIVSGEQCILFGVHVEMRSLLGEYISRRGDSGRGMMLILIGKVKLCSWRTGKEAIEYLTTGAALGVDMLLKSNLCRYTAVADNYVDIFFLSKEHFEEVGSYYPDVMNKLLKRASNVINMY